MKIAIAATAPDENGKISRRGARADCYLVFDETASLCEVIQNSFKDYDHAVGIRVADFLAVKGVDVVAAANLGTSFTKALDAKGISYVKSEGIIREIAKNLAEQFSAEMP